MVSSLLARLALVLIGVYLPFLLHNIFEAIRIAWFLREVPQPTLQSLFGGHVKLITGQAGPRHLAQWAHKFNGVVKLRAYWKQVLLIADPLVLAEFHELEKLGVVEKPDMPRDGFSAGHASLLTEKSSNPWWKLVRKGVAPAFNPANLRAFHYHVVHVMDGLIAGLKAHGSTDSIDMADVARRESFDVIGLVGFGIDFDTRKDMTRAASPVFAPTSDVFAIFHEAGIDFARGFLNPLHQYLRALTFLPWVRRGWEANRKMRELGAGLLKEVRLRGSPNPSDCSVAAHLLRLRQSPSGLPLPDVRLVEEFLTFFVAGTETSGYTVAWALFELVRDPRVMAKLEKELVEAGLLVTPERPHPLPFTYADTQLPYLQAVLKESMRLHPVAQNGMRRKVTRDCRLSNGMLIPRGTITTGSILASHTDPRYWGPNALEFDSVVGASQERWEDASLEFMERGVPGGPSASQRCRANGMDEYDVDVPGVNGRVRRFHPFGGGMRSCIGQSLARMNAPTVLAMLVSNFRFEMDESIAGAGPFDLEILRSTLQMKNGLPLRCIPRHPT